MSSHIALTVLLLLTGLLVGGEHPARAAAAAWPGMPKTMPWSGKPLPPAARTLVWAKPGTGGPALEAGSWLEGGKPASAAPGADCDLVLPDGPTPYVAAFDVFKGLSDQQRLYELTVRSVSIGRNAALDTGTKVVKEWWCRPLGVLAPGLDGILHLTGDLHVAAGGYLYGRVRLEGKGHAVLVLDAKAHHNLLHELLLDKDGGSATLLGAWDVSVGVQVERGRLLLGPASTLRVNVGHAARLEQSQADADGWRAGAGGCHDIKLSTEALDTSLAQVRIAAAGELELLDGAVLASVPRRALQPDILVRGRLLAGDKSRPLTREAELRLSPGAGPAGPLAAAGGLWLDSAGILAVEAKPGVRLACLPAAEPQGAAGISLYLPATLPAGLRLAGLRQPGIYGPDPAKLMAALGQAALDPAGKSAGKALVGLLPAAAIGGAGEVELIDGRKIPCHVLFTHPYAPLLIVRGPKGGALRSFDLELVASVTVAGKKTALNPRRALSDAEKAAMGAALWAEEAGPGTLGRFATETWAPTRTLIWAHPGSSGDGIAAGSWLESDGRPALDHPFGGDQPDLLLPAAGAAYDVLQPGHRDFLGPQHVRHLTIERNAQYMVRYAVHGNCWLRPQAELGGNTQTGDFGSGNPGRHTVFRVEGPGRGGSPTEGMCLSHWTCIDSGETGSFEVVGRSRAAGDRGRLERGTLVVSEGSYFGNGERASYWGRPGTTTVLLQDARLGCNQVWSNENLASLAIDGALWFGHPDKP